MLHCSPRDGAHASCSDGPLELLMRVGVLTISDRVSKGEMEDRGGLAVAKVLTTAYPEVDLTMQTLSDERSQIADLLRLWCDQDLLDAILTTGGTGLGPRDVTPEATLDAIESRVPGIEEAIRALGAVGVPAAMLSRGVAGVRRRTLIVNLPGSPSGAREGAEIVVSVLGHAIDLLHGRTRHDHRAGVEG